MADRVRLIHPTTGEIRDVDPRYVGAHPEFVPLDEQAAPVAPRRRPADTPDITHYAAEESAENRES